MKKILISLFLVLCLMLSVFAVACDSKDNDKDDDKGNKNEQTSKEDNVEANIAKLVSTINKGVDFEALLNEANTGADVQAELDKALDQVKKIAYQASTVATVDGETAEVFVGMKDGVVYANAAGSVAYSFIEDDFKIVAVSQDWEGNWEGYVEDEFSQYINALKNPADLEENEETKMAMDFLKGITLPKIEKSNIKYENGKYVFDNAYLETVAYAALDQFVEYAKELSAGEFDEAEFEAEYDQIKATIAEYLEKFEYSLYCYMKSEKLTGIGASFKASTELANEMGLSKMEVSFDLSTELIAFNANIVEEDGTLVIKGGASISNTFDAKGALTATALKVDISAPYSDYQYEEVYNEQWDEYYHDEACRIEGTATLKIDFTVDYSKVENGEFLKLDGSFARKAEKASVWEETDYYGEYVESAEYTNKYCGTTETLNFNANATAKNNKYTFDGSLKGTMDGEYGELTVDVDATVNGKEIDGTFTASLKANGETQTVSASISANLEAAPGFVAPSAAVQQARQAALNEYNQYN